MLLYCIRIANLSSYFTLDFSSRELSVAGNRLECEGMTELLRPIVALCEASDPSRQIVPALAKLYLQDNAIDIHGTCGGMFAPVISTRALKRSERFCCCSAACMSPFSSRACTVVCSAKSEVVTCTIAMT